MTEPLADATQPTPVCALDGWCLRAVLERAAAPCVVASLVCRRWRSAALALAGEVRAGRCCTERGASRRVRAQLDSTPRRRRPLSGPSGVSRALRYAVPSRRHGPSCLAWLRARCGMPLPHGLCRWLARRGALRCLRWAHASGWPAWDRSVCVAAARSGRPGVVRWLGDMGNPWAGDPELVTTEAARTGRLRLLRWACRTHAHVPPSLPVGQLVEVASEGGHLAVLRWARRRPLACLLLSRIEALRMAAQAGRLRVLRWHARMYDFHEAHAAVLLRGGHRRVFRWLVARGCPLDGAACSAAAHLGDRRLLLRLRDRGLAWDGDTLVAAVVHRRVSLLRWLHDGGCPLGVRATAAASGGGDLRVLRWLRGGDGHEPCPWDPWTYISAAMEGHLGTLRWARAHGCPLPSEWLENCMYDRIAGSGRLNVLRWMAGQGDIPVLWGNVSLMAARCGHLRILRWMLRAGRLPLTADLCESAASGRRLDVLRWLRRIGCPWDERTCLAAARRGELCMLLWARASGCPLSVTKTVDNLIGMYPPMHPQVHRSLVLWMHTHASPSP